MGRHVASFWRCRPRDQNFGLKMSLLGFDAPGRLALGQLSTIGLTNTVLTATSRTYAVAGQVAAFKVLQAGGAATFLTAGSGAILRTVLGVSPSAYLAVGRSLIFQPRL